MKGNNQKTGCPFAAIASHRQSWRVRFWLLLWSVSLGAVSRLLAVLKQRILVYDFFAASPLIKIAVASNTNSDLAMFMLPHQLSETLWASMHVLIRDFRGKQQNYENFALLLKRLTAIQANVNENLSLMHKILSPEDFNSLVRSDNKLGTASGFQSSYRQIMIILGGSNYDFLEEYAKSKMLENMSSVFNYPEFVSEWSGNNLKQMYLRLPQDVQKKLLPEMNALEQEFARNFLIAHLSLVETYIPTAFESTAGNPRFIEYLNRSIAKPLFEL
jgi:hypothetical protein